MAATQSQKHAAQIVSFVFRIDFAATFPEG
jgi:hypothetical protein